MSKESNPHITLNSGLGLNTQYVFVPTHGLSAELIVRTMRDFPEECFWRRNYFLVYRTADGVPPILNDVRRDSRLATGDPVDGYWKNEHGVYFPPDEVNTITPPVDPKSLLTCVPLRLAVAGFDAVINEIDVVDCRRERRLIIMHVFRLLNRFAFYLENRNIYKRSAHAMILGGIAVLSGTRLLEMIALHLLNSRLGVPLDDTIQWTGYILFGCGFIWILLLWIADLWSPKEPFVTLSATLLVKRDEIVTYRKKWLTSCDIPSSQRVVPILDLRVSNRTANRINIRDLVVQADIVPQSPTLPSVFNFSSIQHAGHYSILLTGNDNERQTVSIDIALQPFEMVHISASISQSSDIGDRLFRIYGQVETDHGAKPFGSWVVELGTPDAPYTAGHREPVRAEIRTIDLKPQLEEQAGAPNNADDEGPSPHE